MGAAGGGLSTMARCASVFGLGLEFWGRGDARSGCPVVFLPLWERSPSSSRHIS